MDYHSKAHDFIGRPPSEGDPAELDAAEKSLGIVFPSSVREWYEAIDGRGILAQYSNDDHALKPTEFRMEVIEGKRLVVFMIENQGVCWWGFDPDEGDDPPVYVNVDPPPDKLFTYSAAFSEFTFVRVFDHDGFWDPDKSSLEIYRPMEPDDLMRLRDRFVEEPMSFGWPGDENYRFGSTHGRISIWQNDDQSDWSLSAPSPDDLKSLQASVDDICRPFE